jgi:hypothetical protein
VPEARELKPGCCRQAGFTHSSFPAKEKYSHLLQSYRLALDIRGI